MKPVIDKTLRDSLGNTCRVECWPFGYDSFETYFHDFNESVPRRYIGDAAWSQLHVELWISLKQEEGFKP